MLTHCGPCSNYSTISLSGRGFVAEAWGGRVSGSSPVPLGFSCSPSQLQRPPKIHSKARPHATPFAWIIKLLPAQFGCSPLPKEQQAQLHSSRQLCTAQSSPTAPLCGEWHREAHPQWEEEARGREQEPVAFISHNLGQNSEGAVGPGWVSNLCPTL